jgi:hypothetical protein
VLTFFVVGSTPAVLGFGALTAVVLGAYDYTGGALTGYKKDMEMDEFERKEYLRKNRRRPIEETITELGEGRGTFHSARPITPNILIISKVSMAQDIKKDGQSELRRSMVLRCQSHKSFVNSLSVGPVLDVHMINASS